ncbi:MAG: NADH-quinone oxidoreductase subunit NuoH [Terriglobales bacterium]|jgi:NADH-quinone oxidoreductase subunit H
MPVAPSITTFVVIALVKTVVAILLLLTSVAYLTLFERKLVGHIQNRWGPNRVGPFGLLQPLADGLKFIFKEDITPPYVSKPLYLAAPLIAFTLSVTSIAVIPFSPPVQFGRFWTAIQVTDVNIGLLLILGITSIGVYGVALAGWSSNSKYSLLGSLRASAQMVSYEVALGLSLIGVLILSQSFSLQDIVQAQSGLWWGWLPKWNIFRGQFVAFFIYLCAAYAETNRIPFDLAEAETELVGGYHTEYSSMKFAMFFMAEYANMFTVACLASILFLGGWTGPTFGFGRSWIGGLLHAFWLALRIFGFLFIYVWVRGTLPRFRYDQLMAFTWKVLLPLSLANILVTALVVALKS